MKYATVGFNNGNSVRVTHACNSLRDHNYCRVGKSLAECGLQLCLGSKVESRGRIIENEYFGLADKRTGNRKSLLLTARERRALFGNEGIITVGKFADEGVRLRNGSRRADLFSTCIILAPLNIVGDSVRKVSLLGYLMLFFQERCFLEKYQN